MWQKIELTEEIDMLADENKKMAEYLLYLHECNKIDLIKDEMGWIIHWELDEEK